jgi:hypothetical protein
MISSYRMFTIKRPYFEDVLKIGKYFLGAKGLLPNIGVNFLAKNCWKLVP